VIGAPITVPLGSAAPSEATHNMGGGASIVAVRRAGVVKSTDAMPSTAEQHTFSSSS
jgi:hypothetical protein